jgi:hypothetical protein
VSPTSPPTLRAPVLLFTGVTSDAFAPLVKKLGWSITEDAKTATHLVTEKCRRTEKFLTAMCVVDHIVHFDWLKKCEEEINKMEAKLDVDSGKRKPNNNNCVNSNNNLGTSHKADEKSRKHKSGNSNINAETSKDILPKKDAVVLGTEQLQKPLAFFLPFDERPFMLVDKEFERKYTFNLKKSLEISKKRRETGDRWLQNVKVFCTPALSSNLNSIIQYGGGILVTAKPRKFDPEIIIVAPSDDESGTSSGNSKQSSQDISMIKSLSEMGYDIFTTELILQGALMQELRKEARFLKVAGKK